MTPLDWIKHGWWCLTDESYRKHCRALKNIYKCKPPWDPYLDEACKDLALAEKRIDEENSHMVHFVPKERK